MKKDVLDSIYAAHVSGAGLKVWTSIAHAVLALPSAQRGLMIVHFQSRCRFIKVKRLVWANALEA